MLTLYSGCMPAMYSVKIRRSLGCSPVIQRPIRDADRQRFGSNLSAQVATVTDHITVELIRVWMPETYVDPLRLPLIDSVVASRT